MNLRIFGLATAFAALSLLAGCIVMSVYPFYTDKDVFVDSRIVGRWMKNGDTNTVWTFSVWTQNSYLLAADDNQGTNLFEAHLFRLKQYQFMDLMTTNRDFYALPVHLISKVTVGGGKLGLQFLDYGWLAGLIETNPAVLRHLVVPNDPRNTNSGNMLFLTGETKELQKFLLKHADDVHAFNSNSAVDLTRVNE
jgi:hypothetical protein